MIARWEADPGWLAIEGWPCGSVAIQAHVGAALGENPTELHPWSAQKTEEAEDGALVFQGPGLRLELRAALHGDELTVRGTLVALRALRLAWVAFSVSSTLLQDLGRTTVFRQGYASWTPTYALSAMRCPPRPLSRSFALANHPVDSRWWRERAGVLSSWFTVLAQTSEGLLLGFPRQLSGLGEVILGNDPRHPYLIANLDYGGKALAWGEALELEPLLLAWGPRDALPGRFAERAAEEHEVDAAALQARTAPVGWCSWYTHHTQVRQEDVARAAADLQAFRPHGATVVQLDDGYQAAVGDWRELNAKFSRGLGALAADIRVAGFEGGIWLAPFAAARRSRLVTEHPDWILRDGRGHRVGCGYNPAWGDFLVGLDLSHPCVIGWLTALFQALVADGYDFFKLDFLYTGLRVGVRHDPRCSPVEAYRRGLQAIREAVGPGRFLLGCGAPLGPSVGLVDGMRVSADVRESWGPGLLGWLGRDCGAPSLRESARNNLTRAFLHRRVWLNDPDCMLVRDRHTALSEEEVRLLVTVVAMTGGLGLVSDPLAELPPERRAMLDRALPPTALRPETAGLLELAWPETFTLNGADRSLVALLNWRGRPVARALPDDDAWRFDPWRGEVVTGEEVAVPRHGVRAILLTPRREVPQLIGTDLHLTAPVDGRLEDWFDPVSGALTLLAAEFPASRSELWVTIPSGWRLLEGRPAEVVGERRWEHGIVLTVNAAPPWRFNLRFSRGGSV